ncbi:MAG: TSUP family transporter, partial [Amylibacter sp.]
MHDVTHGTSSDELDGMMEDLVVSPIALALLFFVVAFAYSSVGLGGGSSYTAIMAIFGVGYVVIPAVSLILNLLVTSVGSFNFIRERHAKLRLILPFMVTSIPMSYIGGSLDIQKETFYLVRLVSLVFVAFRIYFWKETAMKLELGKYQRIAL